MTFPRAHARIRSTAILLAALGLALFSQSPKPVRVGPLPDGTFLLNSGSRLTPAGTQIPLSTMPMSSILSRDGKYLIVLNGGYKPPSLSVIDLSQNQVVDTVPVKDAWLGLVLSPNGKTLWVSGGSTATIYQFAFNDGKLSPSREFPLVAPEKRTEADFIGDITTTPGGSLLYAADLYHDSIIVMKTDTGEIAGNFKTGRRPYRLLFHPDGKSLFITSWADGTLHHHNATDGASLQVVRVGAHATDMVWRNREAADEDTAEGAASRLFVSAANTNNVYSIGVSSSKELKVLETINIATTPRHPLGMTPSALALSDDKKTLYTVCSDANAVAVADVSTGRTHVTGFIPTGWYPTAAKGLADGRLVVLNGRGLRSYPNPNGPIPGNPNRAGYVGNLQNGTASIIAPYTPENLDAYTRQVISNSPYNDNLLDQPSGVLPTAIQHVLYIVKENRTYDQVFGDMAQGESDPSLVLFGDKVSPNHHKLAREFALLDNFYVNSDVSADGHNWSTSAISNDYVEKFWPSNYGGRKKGYEFEGGEPAALPPAGYLWTNAAARGITMRNYGHWVKNKPEIAASGPQIQAVLDPVLAPVTNMEYRAFDLNYTDVNRAGVFLKDLAQFEKTGQMPQLMLMCLPNDHTSGTQAGKIAPLASFADNDYALGLIVEALSKSRFWASTAVFVVEDDAQAGPDHIDSHRSPALVLSPYTRRAAVVSTMYNTASVLRTMELILGLRPMTHFDAGARPMFDLFTAQPVLTPYTAEKPRIPLDERNPQVSKTAARSERLDFREADLNDDDELNDILWRAIRKSDPPPPTRSLFGN